MPGPPQGPPIDPQCGPQRGTRDDAFLPGTSPKGTGQPDRLDPQGPSRHSSHGITLTFPPSYFSLFPPLRERRGQDWVLRIIFLECNTNAESNAGNRLSGHRRNGRPSSGADSSPSAARWNYTLPPQPQGRQCPGSLPIRRRRTAQDRRVLPSGRETLGGPLRKNRTGGCCRRDRERLGGPPGLYPLGGHPVLLVGSDPTQAPGPTCA